MASDTSVLPVIDLKAFLEDPNSAEAKDVCNRVAEVLRQTSCLVIRDPRVPEERNQRFLDMMESYFLQPIENLKPDIHPELSYQIGATPEYTEVPRDHKERIKMLTGEDAAHVPIGADAKWRFFWHLGEQPPLTDYPELNAPPVIPRAFPNWGKVMDDWGTLMLQAEHLVAEAAAIGLGLPRDAFTSRMKYGPHLLAPTGSDLAKHSKEGTILAGFHYDLNFLTIHGKSRYPGLFIWLRNGKKFRVVVPDGCLLLQAGKQLEWLTGGHITAGFHEVVVVPETTRVIRERTEKKLPLWRISSTVFGHIASDQVLTPIGKYATPEACASYPPTKTGEQVREELLKIALAAPSVSS